MQALLEIEMSSFDDEEGENEAQGLSTSYAVIGFALLASFLQSTWHMRESTSSIYASLLSFISAVTHSEQLSIFAESIPKNIMHLGVSQALTLIRSHNWLCAHSAIQFMIQIHVYKSLEVETKWRMPTHTISRSSPCKLSWKMWTSPTENV